MKNEFFFESKDKETQIHAIEWIPASQPIAILQIVHGMVEFIDRYDNFARFMAENGIYVVGNDHLGHGLSVKNEERLGYFADKDGVGKVLGDINTLRQMTMQKYPNTPYFILGHSMGAFLARQYIQTEGKGLHGAIIMGTGYQPWIMLTGGRVVSRVIATFKGSKYRSKFVDNLAFGGYNKKFCPARTSKDWLSKDTVVVDAYLSNKLDTFIFTLNGYKNLFATIKGCQSVKNNSTVPKNLPIFVVSGKEDPVGGFGKGVEKVKNNFVKSGIKDVSFKLYEGDRHEILNELDKQTVYADLLAWIQSKKEGNNGKS